VVERGIAVAALVNTTAAAPTNVERCMIEGRVALGSEW